MNRDLLFPGQKLDLTQGSQGSSPSPGLVPDFSPPLEPRLHPTLTSYSAGEQSRTPQHPPVVHSHTRVTYTHTCKGTPHNHEEGQPRPHLWIPSS